MAFSSIVIHSPFKATEGNMVVGQIEIKNNDSEGHTFYIKTWAPDQAQGSKILDEPFIWLWGGESRTFSIQFLMPGVDAEIFVWVEWYSSAGWDYDTSHLKKITVDALPESEPEPEPVPSSEFRGLSVVVS